MAPKKDKELTFEDFRQLAKEPGLSKFEKIGFPNSYREGHEEAILQDIFIKIPELKEQGKVIIDIGCGCSGLVELLIKHCIAHQHTLVLVDSEEMLGQIKIDSECIVKIAGYFPNTNQLFEQYLAKADAIICYSVLHYVFAEGNYMNFIHRAVDLLAADGKLLLGDLPNISKRERFLNSTKGIAFKKNKSELKGATNHIDSTQKIDDAIIFSILCRFRDYNCETYIMPQSETLPMANRREDILIVKR